MSTGKSGASDDRARLCLIVSGRVQGVFYRHSAMREASRLGLSGWVRNLPSGEVEIVAEGASESLRRFLAWANPGPPGARVEEIRERWEEFSDEFIGFRVR